MVSDQVIKFIKRHCSYSHSRGCSLPDRQGRIQLLFDWRLNWRLGQNVWPKWLRVEGGISAKCASSSMSETPTWTFHAQHCWGFTKDGATNRKPPVSGNHVGKHRVDEDEMARIVQAKGGTTNMQIMTLSSSVQNVTLKRTGCLTNPTVIE